MAYDSPKAVHFPIFSIETGKQRSLSESIERSWEIANQVEQVCGCMLNPVGLEQHEIRKIVQDYNNRILPEHGDKCVPDLSWF